MNKGLKFKKEGGNDIIDMKNANMKNANNIFSFNLSVGGNFLKIF